jgi:hypothetical protein
MTKREKHQRDQPPDGAPPVRPRVFKRDEHSSQLLERGEGPTAEEDLDPEVMSDSEITVAGGPGTDAAYEAGGPMEDAEEPENPRERGTGGEGGFSTLGGGVYQDEGKTEDASSAGE